MEDQKSFLISELKSCRNDTLTAQNLEIYEKEKYLIDSWKHNVDATAEH